MGGQDGECGLFTNRYRYGYEGSPNFDYIRVQYSVFLGQLFGELFMDF